MMLKIVDFVQNTHHTGLHKIGASKMSRTLFNDIEF